MLLKQFFQENSQRRQELLDTETKTHLVQTVSIIRNLTEKLKEQSILVKELKIIENNIEIFTKIAAICSYTEDGSESMNPSRKPNILLHELKFAEELTTTIKERKNDYKHFQKYEKKLQKLSSFIEGFLQTRMLKCRIRNSLTFY